MDPPAGVGHTAIFTAYVRLLESRRPDRLFDDSLAEAFTDTIGLGSGDAGKANTTSAPQDTWQHALNQLAVRTRFFDDELLEATRSDDARQVVIIGAGLDTRAFRLAWPDGVRLFELDLTEVLEFKDTALATRAATPLCARTTVPVDLTDDWSPALLAAGFEPNQATAWLAEGVMPYLDEEHNDRMMRNVTQLSGPDSRLAAEHISSHVMSADDTQWTREGLASLGLTWRSAVDDPVAWFERHGWPARAFTGFEIATRYGRRIPVEDPPKGWLVTARLAVR